MVFYISHNQKVLPLSKAKNIALKACTKICFSLYGLRNKAFSSQYIYLLYSNIFELEWWKFNPEKTGLKPYKLNTIRLKTEINTRSCHCTIYSQNYEVKVIYEFSNDGCDGHGKDGEVHWGCNTFLRLILTEGF
jgi:hypothetical protein